MLYNNVVLHNMEVIQRILNGGREWTDNRK